MENKNSKTIKSNNFNDLFKRINTYLDESQKNQKDILNSQKELYNDLEKIFEKFQKQQEEGKKYTLENFESNEKNKFTHTALNIITDPKQNQNQYNPLFIYGKNESEKKHLKYATYNKLNNNNNNNNSNKNKTNNNNNNNDETIIINTEELYLTYLQKENTTKEFIKQCKKSNSIIIDNFEFIDSKNNIQEKLYPILNEFKINKKQIIIFSQIEPRKINLIDKLSEFIESGLFTEI